MFNSSAIEINTFIPFHVQKSLHYAHPQPTETINTLNTKPANYNLVCTLSYTER